MGYQYLYWNPVLGSRLGASIFTEIGPNTFIDENISRMAHTHYRRWPQACEYAGRPQITSWWPRKQSEIYCIAPALNVLYDNYETPNNPVGSLKWGSRLTHSDGLQWEYGHFDFPSSPDYRMYVRFQQVYGLFDEPILYVKVDIVRSGIFKTAEGYRLIGETDLKKDPWAHSIVVTLYEGSSQPRYPHISVRLLPVRVGLMLDPNPDELSTN